MTWIDVYEIFEHPKMDRYRIIVPEILEQHTIKRFHNSPQGRKFATGIIENKELNDL